MARYPHQTQESQNLATLRDHRLRASEQTVARNQQGNWREEHRFALAQALAHDDFLGQPIAECDQMINYRRCNAYQPSPIRFPPPSNRCVVPIVPVLSQRNGIKS